MLKTSKKIISIFTAIVMSLALGVTAFADGTTSAPIQTVEEYQKVIQEVNEEYGSFFCVPEERELEVLENIKELNETPEDLRNNLIAAWKEYLATEEQGEVHNKVSLSDSDKIDIPSTDIPSQDPVTVIPYSVSSDIRQEIPIEYNSSLYLESTVFSATGAPGTLVYNAIRGKGVSYLASASVHFQPTQISGQLSGDRKSYSMTATGYPLTSEGVILPVTKTYSATFYANA